MPATTPKPKANDLRLTTIFKTGDPALISIVGSILESADIPFTTRNELVQDFFGVGRLPKGANIVTGPVVFEVNEDDAEDAASLLRELEPLKEAQPADDDDNSAPSTVAIRDETSSDSDAIREVHDRAFGREGEGMLVDLLRDNDKITVSLVALADEQIVGHILFSPMTVANSYIGFRGVGLAPVAVIPEFQNNGIGSDLIHKGLAECRQADCDAVFVLGDPAFYSRFGFSRASQHHLSNEYNADEAFMALELKPGVLQRLAGLVRYAPEFSVTGR